MAESLQTDEVRAAEAQLVAELISGYKRIRDTQYDGDTVFVVTPHHTQRLAVTHAIDSRGLADEYFDVTIDTVERMLSSPEALARFAIHPGTRD